MMYAREELFTKKIGVLGSGVNNIGLIRWLLSRGASHVTICDVNPTLRHDHPEWEGKVIWRLGDNYLSHLIDFEIIFRTPGIPYFSSAIQQAKRAGVVISSQTKLFFELSPAKIIGVTGTKGKGTTATLIAEILSAQRRKNQKSGSVYLAGNIGRDPFEFLDELSPSDWVVLELSSFQLQDAEKSPHIAVVLDITSDHLDHHKSRDEYVAAKTPILANQYPDDFAILANDMRDIDQFSRIGKGKKFFVSRRVEVKQGVFVRWVEGPGQKIGEIIFRHDSSAEQNLVRTDGLILRGEHNLENIGAAAIAARLAGADFQKISETIRTFPGLEHRLEFVGEIAGRRFYNDSFATNPEPTIAAIRSFFEPIHLIVGGSTKHADYSELANVIVSSKNLASIVPLGRDESLRITAAIEAVPQTRDGLMIHSPQDTMDDAVFWAYRGSQPGDVIVLSPAAASFDLFKNYKERGVSFRLAVQKLKDRS